MKKKLICFLLIIPMLLVSISYLSSCFLLDGYNLQTTDFYDDSCNITNSSVPLYKESNSKIRYIDLKTMMKLLSYIYTNRDDLFTYEQSNNILTCSYEGIYNDKRYIKFDANKNIVYLSGYDFYSYIPTQTQTSTAVMEYSRLYENEVEINLNKYDININIYRNLLLLPVEIACLITSSPTNYNLSYIPQNLSSNSYRNGTLFGYYGDFSNSKYYNNINSALGGTTCSSETRELTYKYILILLDNFYGLKEYLGFESTNDIIEDLAPYKEDILSTDTKTFQTAEANYFSKRLADLHTSVKSLSYYNIESSNQYTHIMSLSDIDHSDKYNKERENLQKYTDYYNISSISNLFNYEGVNYIYGDTAKIKLDSFSYYPKDGSNPLSKAYVNNDTFAYFYYAFANIEKYNKKNSNVVKNIIIDLSTNTGGSVISLFEALSFLTNENISWYLDYNSTASYHYITYNIDNNLDGDYYDKDAYTSYNYYLLTTDVTFSAANLFATLFKDMNLGKIIGLKSNGGMCVVGYSLLPDGMSINHSSIMQNIHLVNDLYLGNEDGISVDYEVSNVSYLYNKEYLSNLIDTIE